MREVLQKCFAELSGSVVAPPSSSLSELHPADELKQTSTAARSEPFAFYSSAGSVKMCHFCQLEERSCL